MSTIPVLPPLPMSSAPHVPPPDDRDPPTRRKLMAFDRLKVLVIIGLVLFFSVAKRRSDVPIMSVGDAIDEQLKAKAWLLWLAGIEAVRQLHYVVSEHSARYNQFWVKKVWGRWDRRMSRLNPWLRFRLGRMVKVVFIGTLVVFWLSFVWGIAPVTALVEAPSRLWNKAFGPATGMPFVIQIAFTLLFGIAQFAALFWFMSKGGYETLMPDEVTTRFRDVWGQDKVLDKVKENIVFLEKPAEIEERGGHVPSGLLLWGPPGTGKTMIAQAVAGETGRPYVFIDPGAFQAMFMGVGILKVRAVFRKLRKLALRHGGVIAFFDEADSLGNRGLATGGFGGNGAGFEVSHLCNGAHYVTHDTASRIQRDAVVEARAAAAAATPEATRPSVRQIIMGGGMNGGMGTLQALLTEISGLEKPRGFLWRRARRFLGMPSKKPPKYRILIMMATNMPEALDDALLRPGRIDRIYKVDYPSLEGRKRTYEGYLNKVRNSITPEQVERISLMSPDASGARIKDIVNEGLIQALRDGRDIVTWPDLLRAKQLKTHGVPDDVHSVALERHAVALHEASHAVAMYRLKRREMIDIATIEPRGPVGGFVAPVPLQQAGFPWRYIQEDEIVTFLASLAGERHFFAGDNSVGVGGDLRASTNLMMGMLGGAAMGSHVAMRGSMGGMSAGRMFLEADEYLKKLLDRAFALIVENERWVMAIAHALEQHFTITGEDIVAIFEGTQGPIVDGRWYHTDDFVDQYRQYHEVALQAHQHQGRLETALPLPQLVEAHETAGATDGALWSAMPEPVFNGNGNGNGFGSDGPLTLPPPPPPPSELP